MHILVRLRINLAWDGSINGLIFTWIVQLGCWFRGDLNIVHLHVHKSSSGQKIKFYLTSKVLLYLWIFGFRMTFLTRACFQTIRRLRVIILAI